MNITMISLLLKRRKSEIINKFIRPKYMVGGPILVAGDAVGDEHI